MLIVTSSHPVTVSSFLSQHNDVVSPSLLLIVIFSVFFVFSFSMSVNTRGVCWLHCKYFSEWSYYRYLSSLFLSQHNGIILPSLLLNVIFSHINPPPTHIWLQPLVGITDYIGSTFLIDQIIGMHHHCFSPSTVESF